MLVWLVVCFSVASVWWRCLRARRNHNYSSSPRRSSRQWPSVLSATRSSAAAVTSRSARASMLISCCHTSLPLTSSSASAYLPFTSSPPTQLYSIMAGIILVRCAFCTDLTRDTIQLVQYNVDVNVIQQFTERIVTEPLIQDLKRYFCNRHCTPFFQTTTKKQNQ